MKIIKDKRGAEYLYMYIFYVVFIIFILVALIYWTNDLAKNEDFKRKQIAKELVLILDAGVPDTTFLIETENVTITLNDKIEVKKKLEFFYDFYSPYINVLEKEKDGIFSLKITK